MSLSVFFLLTVLAVLWGSAFPGIKIGLETLSAGHLTLLRHIVASISFIPFLLLTKRRVLPDTKDVPYFFLLGALGIAIYHSTLNFGELHVSAGAASLLIATAPAFTAIVAYFLLKDNLPGMGWLGIVVSFAGILLIVMGEDKGLSLNPYALLILISALVTAFFAVLQKPVLTRYKPVEVTAFATWAGTVQLLVFLPGFAQDVSTASNASLLATLYIGVVPSAIAYTIFATAIARADVTLVAAFLYTVPIFSLLFSWLLLNETPGSLTITGGVIAVLGVMIVNQAKKRARNKARALATD